MAATLQDAKIAFVGASGVGKSSIVARMAFGKAASLPNELTIAAAYAQLETSKYKLLIWDTAGSERFQTFLPMYLRGARVVMAVYDVTDKKSLEYVQRERARLVRDEIVPTSVPWILVGNKVDVPESAHQVPHRQAQALADSWTSAQSGVWEQIAGTESAFCEGLHLRVSAKTTSNIDRLVALIVTALDKQTFEPAPPVTYALSGTSASAPTVKLTHVAEEEKENSTKSRFKPCC